MKKKNTTLVDGKPIPVTRTRVKVVQAAEKKTSWVIPTTLSPATYCTHVLGEATQDIKLALQCASKEDAIEERDFMNLFLPADERLKYEPLMHVI